MNKTDYWAQKGKTEQRTVTVLECSWCKRRGAGVTWTKTPKGLMHLDCPKRPQNEPEAA